MIPGWTATLATWQQQRRRAAIAADDPAADMASMQATTDAFLAALDGSSWHQAIACAVLALEPYYPLADEILRINAGLFALDFDEAELLLALWRAERAREQVAA